MERVSDKGNLTADKIPDGYRASRGCLSKLTKEVKYIWKQIIIAGLKNHEEFDLKRAARAARAVQEKEISEILENFSDHIEKIAKNPERYEDVISLLCFHTYAVKGELFSDYPTEEQRSILENAVYASFKAFSIAKKLGEKELEASYMGQAGNALSRLHLFTEAEKTFRKALGIFKDLAAENPEKHEFSVAITLDNIGTFYSSTGKFSQAEKMYNEAFKIMEKLAGKDPDTYAPHMATTLDNLGNFYKDAGKFFEAEEAYTRALEIKRNLAQKDPATYRPAVALTLNSLGLLHFDTTDFPQVTKKYTEAKKEYDRAKRRYTEAKKEYNKIEDEYTEALEIYKDFAERNPEKYLPHVAGCSNNIGNYYIRKKQLQQAERAYKESLEKYRILEKQNPSVYTHQVAASLNNLGVLYNATKPHPQAKKAYNEAVKKYKEVALWFDASRTYYNLSTIESDDKALEKSRRSLELGILFSKEEKYKYAQKGANESMYLRLLEKDISTFGVLEALRDPQFLSLPWEEIPEEDLKKAQEDTDTQKEVVEAVLRMNLLYYEPAALPDNLVFIYIQLIGNSVCFFAVDDNKIRKFKCQKEFFDKGVDLYYSLEMQQKNWIGTRIFENRSRQWYKILPHEIKELIREKGYIVFSPDFYCSFLPLEALQMDGEPLCIEKTLVRATSLLQFSSLLKKKPIFDSSLVVGNPWPQCNRRGLTYCLPGEDKSSTISFLGGAKREAKILKRKLPNSTLLLGSEATGDKFLSKIKNKSPIHFSGHGSMGRILFLSGPFNGFSPPFEPKEFSDIRKKERIEGTKKINMMEEWYPVTDVELADVKLKDGTIVFLNACKTGQHKYEKGGYYQGLSAAFLKNGAHSVISSLIPLFDEPSKEFAIIFYKELLKTYSVSQSLKKARICIRKACKSQIHWIPYLHYGSPF